MKNDPADVYHFISEYVVLVENDVNTACDIANNCKVVKFFSNQIWNFHRNDPFHLQKRNSSKTGVIVGTMQNRNKLTTSFRSLFF